MKAKIQREALLLLISFPPHMIPWCDRRLTCEGGDLFKYLHVSDYWLSSQIPHQMVVKKMSS